MGGADARTTRRGRKRKRRGEDEDRRGGDTNLPHRTSSASGERSTPTPEPAESESYFL